ncbi:MAG: peptidase MA family metallohydrolase [Calditrichota bacterium]
MIAGSSVQAQIPQYIAQDSGRFRVAFTADDAEIIPDLWQTIKLRVPIVESRLGLGLADTATFVVTPTEQEWRRMTGGAPLWANGLAFSEKGVAILKSPRFNLRFGRSLPVTAIHEYVHLLLHAGAPDAEIPRWLDEGLAQVLAEQMDYRDDALVARAAVIGQLHRLRDIEWLMSMPAQEARQAYAESAIAVGLLESRFGMPGIANLLHEVRGGRPYNEAFSTVFQISPGDFENEFREHVRQNYRLTFLGDTETWISIAFIGLVLAAGIAVWLKRRKTVKRWEEEDRPRTGDPSSSPPPYTINYQVIRERLRERGDADPPKDEPPFDRPVPGN